MADDRRRDLDAGPGAERRADPRSPVSVKVRCHYESVLDFEETQSVNISVSGMYIATDKPPPVGSKVEFEFTLSDDAFTLLAGTAEVMRIVTGGPLPGMGVRFIDLDPQYRKLIERIVAVNADEGRSSAHSLDFSRSSSSPSPSPSAPLRPAPPPPPAAAAAPAVGPATGPIQIDGRSLRLTLGPATVTHFTSNPLINVRAGGFFVPVDEDVPLGTVLDVEIADAAGRALLSGKGKVIAKQQLRIGVRLTDVDKEVLARLQGEVAKLAPRK